MKFDASRAESLFRELGDAPYAGPGGESKVADLLSGQFAEAGLCVERREVFGSRFPRRVGPWVGWLGYGFLVTSVYALLLHDNPVTRFMAVVVMCVPHLWLAGIVNERFRPGRQRPPIESAPLLIASLPGRRPAPLRVVFHSTITRVRANPFPFFKDHLKSYLLDGFLSLFPFLCAMFIVGCRVGFLKNPSRVGLLVLDAALMRYAYPCFLVLVWIVIVTVLSQEYRIQRLATERGRIDRHGLAVLMEMARTWPRTGSRSVEPVFVVAGGYQLDDAGRREVVRLLKSDWASPDYLLVLFVSPGAGEDLWLCTNAARDSGLAELAASSARSLWIPCRQGASLAWLPFAPYQSFPPAIALVGMPPADLDEMALDPQALHRAAQLATEIALRWARQQKEDGVSESAG